MRISDLYPIMGEASKTAEEKTTPDGERITWPGQGRGWGPRRHKPAAHPWPDYERRRPDDATKPARGATPSKTVKQ